MKINRNKNQKGIAQFLLIAIMGIIALGLPTATKLVQQNQENRSKATNERKNKLSNFDNKPKKAQIINGACGKIKYNELTETSDKDKPALLCKSGKAENFGKMTPNCVMANNCPPSIYSWICASINNGKNVKCSIKQNNIPISSSDPVSITEIKINPSNLKIKIGQTRNLTYILSPSKTTDTIKWSTSGNGSVRIQKLTSKSSEKNQLIVTGLKTGTINITLTTNTGKSATAKVIIYK